MNAPDLLDYALGQLEGADRDRVEADLAVDPALAERFERLGRSIHRLLDDGADLAPPPGLAHQTLSFVAQRAQERRRTILDFVPTRVPFRWGDVVVAAGIFMAGLLTLLPAVSRSRERMAQAGCTYNLQRIGQALWNYGGQHGRLPYLPEHDPKADTGAFVLLLHEAKALPDLSVLDCPCNGPCGRHPAPPRFRDLAALRASDPARYHSALCWDYAYNVSYRDKRSGRLVPIEIHTIATAMVPVLADQPNHENYRLIRAGNSPNHGGRGQNVLYADLHVGFHNSRRITPQDEDLYLNAARELAPGVEAWDFVLLPSQTPFEGWPSR